MNIRILLPQISFSAQNLQSYAVYLSGTLLEFLHTGHHKLLDTAATTTQRSKSRVTSPESVLI